MVDANLQTTTYSYNDSMGRLTDVLYPDVYPGSSTHGETIYTYNDTASPVNVVVKEVVSPTVTVQGEVLVDGFGRETQTAVQNGEASPSNWDMQDICYDERGLKHFVSYTYQGSGPSSPNCSSGTGDTYAYDAIGRTTTVTHSDGTHIDNSYTGRATSSTGEGNGSYRVQRISQADALGNLKYVCEVSGTTQQGSSNNAPAGCGLDASGSGFLTSYTYDALGNVTLVQQAGMGNRSFVYDTLSRLTSATNPESGTTQYVYNQDGQVINRLRPKANQTNASVLTTTTYTPDNIHRLLSASYDDGNTPTENHSYDQTSVWGVSIANPVGRQTRSWTALNGTTLTDQLFSYDPVGRTIENDQCTPGNCGSSSWPVTYTYDLLGSTLTSTNGLGTTITNSYNAGDRLSGITSSLTGTGYVGTLLSGMHYGAFGLTGASWGNGLAEARTYDTRGRLQSRTDTLSGSTAYGYSLTLAGDGSITYASDTVNGNWTYTYDDFGRLSTGSSSSASYAWDYDRYGNRWHQTLTAGTGLTYIASFSGANNRVDGWSYDAAGNVLHDDHHSYTYDAEGRIATVDSSTSYVYDASGLRVAKKVNGALTSQYIYDLGSRVVSETNGSGGWTRGEVYAGGRHVATYQGGNTYFTHADWLGTERGRSNLSGSVCERNTSLAFGDGEASSGSCIASPQFFTGKQRDTESNLDYFKARFYNSSAGRWMLPDWSSVPVAVPYASFTQPQTLNLYTYVGNDPVSHVDVDGHLLNTPGQLGSHWGSSGAQALMAAMTGSIASIQDADLADAQQREEQAQQTKEPELVVTVNIVYSNQKINSDTKETVANYGVASMDEKGNVSPTNPVETHSMTFTESLDPKKSTGKPAGGICNKPCGGDLNGAATYPDTMRVSGKNVYVLDKHFKIDGQPARVINPETGKPADFIHQESAFKKGTVLSYENNP